MRILLMTRCGCTQWREIPDTTPPPKYIIPLSPLPVTTASYHEFDPSVMLDIQVRHFEYMDTSRHKSFHVYTEGK